MDVTWDPEDGTEPVRFQFDPEELFSKEAVAIEKEYGGQPLEVFVNALRVKEAKARRVLLWWWMRQTHRGLAFKDVPDFRMRQMKVEMSVAELHELWATTSSTLASMNDEQREQVTILFERDLRDAMKREGIEGEVSLAGTSSPKEPE